MAPAPCTPFAALRPIALVAACVVLAGCGQKGPLTLPKSATAAASAPAR
ncbi:MAG TPA: lipoprotein [Burkholderiaceae bacterium]|nr:lipoprotein [Burkholderiaceae bacterium]